MRDPNPYVDPDLAIDPFIQPYLEVKHPSGIQNGDPAKPMSYQLEAILAAHPEIRRGLALVYVPYWGHFEYKFGTNIVVNREEYLLSKGFSGQLCETNGFVLTAKAAAFAQDIGYERELNSFDRSVALDAVLKKHGFQRVVWVCSRNLQQMWQDGLPDDLRASHELRMER